MSLTRQHPPTPPAAAGGPAAGPRRPRSVRQAAATWLVVTAALVASLTAPGGVGVTAGAAPETRMAAQSLPGGYWLYAADGGVFSFGAAGFHGAIGNQGADIAGMAATPSADGYWLVDDDGDVFRSGAAPDFGSRVADVDDIAAFATRPQGDGYWMATRTGSVEAYGAAPARGGVAVQRSHRIVAMTPTRSGDGYWMGALDGGVFSFGDAAFLGSMGAVRLNQPIVGMAATPSGAGYWLVASDGGVFSFGDAPFLGSMGAVRLNQPIVGIVPVKVDAGVSTAAVPPAADGPVPPLVVSPPVPPSPVAPPPPPPPLPPLPPVGPVATLVGAGDIASCSVNGDEATAKLLDGVIAADPAATVFTVGDNAYDNGTPSEFTNCYGPTWGRHRDRTRPATGNHEYGTTNASGHFGYFGTRAGEPAKGYYSYDVGAWHVVVLNSNCSKVGGCGAGSPQEKWLRADLAASAASCTVAYWHHPRFNSGSYGNDSSVAAFWKALHEFGAEVVLNGHSHLYERFAPQRPDGTADPAFGIRQFIVGMGGRSNYPFGTVQANSEVRNSDTNGVMKLTLRPDGYDFAFLPVAGRSFTDTGSGTCHGRP